MENEELVENRIDNLIQDFKADVSSHAGFNGMYISQMWLQSFQEHGDLALERLTRELKSKINDKTCKAIYVILEEFGRPIPVELLKEMLLYAELSSVRIWAVRTLGKTGSEDARDVLTQTLLTDDEIGIRLEIIRTLGKTMDERVLNAFEQIILHDSNIGIKSEVVRYLLLYGGQHAQISSKLIAIALEDADGTLVTWLINYLDNKQNNLNIAVARLIDSIIDELIIRKSNLPKIYFNASVVSSAMRTLISRSPRTHSLVLQNLCDVAFEYEGEIQNRSILVAQKLNEKEFRSLVDHRSNEHPEIAKGILAFLQGHSSTDRIIEELSETDPKDIQKIAATQIQLLKVYYEDVLTQSNTSFYWAIFATVFGLLCLVATIGYLISIGSADIVSIITAISSVLSQFIAGAQFYLYGQARKQLAYFHEQLNQTQRFLLANSVCEALEGEAKEKTRMELVRQIATFELGAGKPPTTLQS